MIENKKCNAKTVNKMNCGTRPSVHFCVFCRSTFPRHYFLRLLHSMFFASSFHHFKSRQFYSIAHCLWSHFRLPKTENRAADKKKSSERKCNAKIIRRRQQALWHSIRQSFFGYFCTLFPCSTFLAAANATQSGANDKHIQNEWISGDFQSFRLHFCFIVIGTAIALNLSEIRHSTTLFTIQRINYRNDVTTRIASIWEYQTKSSQQSILSLAIFSSVRLLFFDGFVYFFCDWDRRTHSKQAKLR